MTWTDKMACGELVQRWGLYRDQARWDELLQTFHPQASISVSWFSGSAVEFVERARRNFDATRTKNITKHQIWPPVVAVNGDRAIAETSVAILAREKLDGFFVDNSSLARFFDRLERYNGEWRILARTAIYEKDRFDPVDCHERFYQFMDRSDFSSIPVAYRYIGYRILHSGREIAEDVHVDGSERVWTLYERGRQWLVEGE